MRNKLKITWLGEAEGRFGISALLFAWALVIALLWLTVTQGHADLVQALLERLAANLSGQTK